jgi:hypothetical protein
MLLLSTKYYTKINKPIGCSWSTGLARLSLVLKDCSLDLGIVDNQLFQIWSSSTFTWLNLGSEFIMAYLATTEKDWSSFQSDTKMGMFVVDSNLDMTKHNTFHFPSNEAVKYWSIEYCILKKICQSIIPLYPKKINKPKGNVHGKLNITNQRKKKIGI